jgi:hypothetical protein
MRRSLKPRKSAKLSKSLYKPLNMYALSATAAGVGLLALAQPAEAEVVYTPAHTVILPNTNFYLDLNHDGIIDFVFRNIYRPSEGQGFGGLSAEGPSCRQFRHLTCPNALEAATSDGRLTPAYALPFGAVIGPPKVFSGATMTYFNGSGPNSCLFFCQWGNATNRYLGMQFLDVNGATHYGWARMSVRTIFQEKYVALLTGYAYETVPDKPIIAGHKKGATDNPSNDPESAKPELGPGASLTNPTPDEPQAASLGMLAAGAQGVPAWRRKERSAETAPDKAVVN